MSTTRDVSLQSDINKLPIEKDGSFKRIPSSFRSTIEKGGRFEPEAGRYHLYVSYGCPWATRALIVRKLKGLDDIIGLTVVSPLLAENGWPFKAGAAFDVPGTEDDPLYGFKYLRELYFKAEPEYTGRFTVPVLWDKNLETIVNNESSEIIRIFNTAVNELLPADKASLDLYPENLCAEIDEKNEWIYASLNNGVYRTGFATTQQVYEQSVREVFDALDRVEKLLEGKDYLVGGTLTEADVRLWVTTIRFDVAYHGHFKCNLGSIRHNYPSINRWMKQLYWKNDAFKSSTNFTHIKAGYYWAQSNVNPTRIITVGPIPEIEPL